LLTTLVLQHLLKPEFARKLHQPAHKTNQLEETAMQITTILNAKGHDVITISPDATVKDLAALLREKKIGAIVVSRDGKKIDGIVSERDVVHRLTDFGPKYLSVAVKEIMTAHVRDLLTDDSVDSCMELMSGRRIRHLPVVQWQAGRGGVDRRHRQGEDPGDSHRGRVAEAIHRRLSASAVTVRPGGVRGPACRARR
jgi:signal-transduction protein with cAMP-binding, CBS, and nucleotidyltransferase domain